MCLKHFKRFFVQIEEVEIIMGQTGYSCSGGKNFKVHTFEDYSITICPCGRSYDSTEYDRRPDAWATWEKEHRPHLDAKRGTMPGALAFAEDCVKGLTTGDLRFAHAVHVAHKDGSSMFLARSFLVTWKEFVIVVTECHGYFAYDKEDASCIEYVVASSVTSP